jgi:hypothetical protein
VSYLGAIVSYLDAKVSYFGVTEHQPPYEYPLVLLNDLLTKKRKS